MGYPDFIQFTEMPIKKENPPLLLSVPHSGVLFPQTVKEQINEQFWKFPEDTDWLVHDLYDFCSDLGVSLVYSNYSRYVVDLNRSPENTKLYGDKRLQTTVVPTVSFNNQKIYKPGFEPDEQAVNERIQLFHKPYHQFIKNHLEKLRSVHSHVLLFDGHSIRRHVESIQNAPFPDMIIGTRDGQSCATQLQNVAQEVLIDQSQYHVTLNSPFKGGHITQSFGQPDKGIHSMQLEISQDTYLANPAGDKANSIDDISFDSQKAAQLKTTLKKLITELVHQLKVMNQ